MSSQVPHNFHVSPGWGCSPAIIAAFAHPAKLTEDHFKKLKSMDIHSLVPTYTEQHCKFRASAPFMRRCVNNFSLSSWSWTTLEFDFTFSTESRRRAEDILIETKATYHIQLFSGVVHGFATRGDPNVENSRKFPIISFRGFNRHLPITGWAKEHAARTVIEWFDRFTNTKGLQ